MITAVLTSPTIAIQIDKCFEKIRDKKKRKLKIFRTLMATRANTIDPRHVEALNMIDIDFSDSEDVKNAWNNYLDHLGKKPRPPIKGFKTNQEEQFHNHKLASWCEKSSPFLIKLLQVMGKSLSYDFNETHINNSHYYPEGSAKKEQDLLILRQQLVGLVEGRIALPVIIYEEAIIKKNNNMNKSS